MSASPKKSSFKEEREGKLHLQAKCARRNSACPFPVPAKPKPTVSFESGYKAQLGLRAYYCWRSGSGHSVENTRSATLILSGSKQQTKGRRHRILITTQI